MFHLFGQGGVLYYIPANFLFCIHVFGICFCLLVQLIVFTHCYKRQFYFYNFFYNFYNFFWDFHVILHTKFYYLYIYTVFFRFRIFTYKKIYHGGCKNLFLYGCLFSYIKPFSIFLWCITNQLGGSLSLARKMVDLFSFIRWILIKLFISIRLTT